MSSPICANRPASAASDSVTTVALYVTRSGRPAENLSSRGFEGPAQKIVLAHGFTQNLNCWGTFGELLAEAHSLRLVDLPGHGRSEHDDADLVESGELLVAAGGEGTYLGYSMGGRIALHAALNQADKVQKLVLIGVNPGLSTIAEQVSRRAHDESLALDLSRVGLAKFLSLWLENPLFAGLSEAQAKLEQRLENRPTGLLSSLRKRSLGQQEPLSERLAELTMPVLLVAGESDKKYCSLNRCMAQLIPNVESVVIPGGHAVHLQQPEATFDAIQPFLARR